MRLSFPGALRPILQRIRDLHRDRGSVWRFYLPAVLLPMSLFVILVVLPAVGLYINRAGSETVPADSETAVAPAGPSEDDVSGSARFDSLSAVEAFLDARLALADTRRIGLVVDLTAGTVSIEIEGVPLRICPIRHARKSRALPAAIADDNGAAKLLFALVSEQATISKAPIRVVQAPQDTAEANARPPEDFPEETRAPHVRLDFERGLLVKIRSEPRSLGDGLAAAVLDLRGRFVDLGDTFAALAHGNLPTLRPWIVVTLSPEDARAIYRALPSDARLAVRP